MEYRPLLDSLRGLAVILVLLFHCDVSYFSNGFVGVDVFFVLSGFLISSLLFAELKKSGTINFCCFYAKRARRLLPQSFFVLLCCILLYRWMYSMELFEMRRNWFLGPAFYIANWMYISEAADYWADNINKSPTLHYWSLSVEEQFYLAFPLVLYILYSSISRYLSIVLACLFLLFCWFAYAENNVSVAHMSTIGRLYQFALGVMTAYWSDKIYQNIKDARILLGFLKYQVLEYMGLCIICIFSSPIVGMKSNYISFVAAFSTTILLLGLELNWINDKQLNRNTLWNVEEDAGESKIRKFKKKGLEFFRHVGLHSYGIYLWHWPMIIYGSHFRILKDPGLLNFFFIFINSYMVTRFLGNLIESTARKHLSLQHRRLQIVTILFSFLLPALFYALIEVSAKVSFACHCPEINTYNTPTPPNFESSIINFATERDNNEKKIHGNCKDGGSYKLSNYGGTDNPYSMYTGAEESPLIAVMGDSYSAVFAHAAERLNKELNISIAHFALKGCPHLMGSWEVRTIEYQKCKNHLNYMFDTLRMLKPKICIYLQGYWYASMKFQNPNTTKYVTIDDIEYNDIYFANSHQFFEKLIDVGCFIVAFNTTTTTNNKNYFECVKVAKKCSDCDVPLDSLNAQIESQQALEKYIKRKDAIMIDLNDGVICKFGVCPGIFNHRATMFDNSHIAPEYWTELVPEVVTRLQRYGISLNNGTVSIE